jgi:hypothetical protein
MLYAMRDQRVIPPAATAKANQPIVVIGDCISMQQANT